MENPLLVNWEKKSRERQKLYKQFLQRVSKNEVLSRQQEIHEEAFNKVDCLSCANCCKKYSPRFKTPDIKRISKLLGLREGVFIETYLKDRFSRNSRQVFRSNKKRLETCFDISYNMYYGAISIEQYSKLFKQFYDMLKLRAKEKRINNRNLKHWSLYNSKVYEYGDLFHIPNQEYYRPLEHQYLKEFQIF